MDHSSSQIHTENISNVANNQSDCLIDQNTNKENNINQFLDKIESKNPTRSKQKQLIQPTQTSDENLILTSSMMNFNTSTGINTVKQQKTNANILTETGLEYLSEDTIGNQINLAHHLGSAINNNAHGNKTDHKNYQNVNLNLNLKKGSKSICNGDQNPIDSNITSNKKEFDRMNTTIEDKYHSQWLCEKERQKR